MKIIILSLEEIKGGVGRVMCNREGGGHHFCRKYDNQSEQKSRFHFHIKTCKMTMYYMTSDVESVGNS